MKKTKKRKRHRKAKHSRFAPTQLAGLLCQRTKYSPERLLKIAAQLAGCAEVRIQLRAVRKQLRELRNPDKTRAAQASALAAESERQSRDHIALSLHLAQFPPSFCEPLHASHSDPRRVAAELLSALRIVH